MRFHWSRLGSECEILPNQVSKSAPTTVIFKACTHILLHFPTLTWTIPLKTTEFSPILAPHLSNHKNKDKQYRCFVRDFHDCISRLKFNVRPTKVKTSSMGGKTTRETRGTNARLLMVFQVLSGHPFWEHHSCRLISGPISDGSTCRTFCRTSTLHFQSPRHSSGPSPASCHNYDPPWWASQRDPPPRLLGSAFDIKNQQYVWACVKPAAMLLFVLIPRSLQSGDCPCGQMHHIRPSALRILATTEQHSSASSLNCSTGSLQAPAPSVHNSGGARRDQPKPLLPRARTLTSHNSPPLNYWKTISLFQGG